MRNKHFTFKIEGDDVSPDAVSMRDLFDVLKDLESVLSITARHQGAKPDDDLTISLVSVTASSDKLGIATSEKMLRAATRVSRSVAANDFSELSIQTHRGLRSLWRKANANKWILGFDADGNGVPESRIRHDAEILKPGVISGRTTLYGKLDRVGGEAKPTAHFILLSGEHHTIRIKGKALAETLGERLFDVIGLEGVATWDLDKWELEDFRADSITEYEDVDVVQAFQNLSDAAGSHWDDVDPEQFVSELHAD